MRAAVALAGAVLLVACTSTIQHPVPGGPAFESDEVRFVAPAGWQLREAARPTNGPGKLFVYLANQPLRDGCSVAQGGCDSPLVEPLRPGGVLAIWATRLCVAQGCDLPSASPMAVGNRQGVVTVPDSGCEETGYTERSAYYVTVTPQRVDTLLVCASDPSDATRSAFAGFLDAIHWRIP